MRSIVITVLLTLAAVTGGALAWLLSGRLDVAATTPHHPLVAWLLEETREASIERHARGIEVPPLDDPALLAIGAEHYDAMCAGCHTPPGGRESELARGLNPPAPDLAKEADDLSAAETYWVIRNGIRMTGMPAWGPTHDERALWGLTAFVRRLPAMDAAAYQAAVAAAREAGHHHHDHAGHGHEHGAHDQAPQAAGDAQAQPQGHHPPPHGDTAGPPSGEVTAPPSVHDHAAHAH